MNYIAMLSMVRDELNKQTEEIKQCIKEEYDKAYKDGFNSGKDYGYNKGYVEGYVQCRRENKEEQQ